MMFSWCHVPNKGPLRVPYKLLWIGVRGLGLQLWTPKSSPHRLLSGIGHNAASKSSGVAVLEGHAHSSASLKLNHDSFIAMSNHAQQYMMRKRMQKKIQACEICHLIWICCSFPPGDPCGHWPLSKNEHGCWLRCQACRSETLASPN